MNWNVRRMWMKCDWLRLWKLAMLIRLCPRLRFWKSGRDWVDQIYSNISAITIAKLMNADLNNSEFPNSSIIAVKTGFDQGLTFEVQAARMSIGLEWRWNGVGMELNRIKLIYIYIKLSWPGFKNFKLMRSWPGLQKFQVDQDLKIKLQNSSWPGV